MNRRLKSLLTELIESNRELTKALDPTLAVKAEKYDKTEAMLKDIRIGVKNTRMVVDPDSGRIGIEIIYEMPRTTIWLDEEGKTQSPESFRSMNGLNLISVKDTERIRKAINEVLRKCN